MGRPIWQIGWPIWHFLLPHVDLHLHKVETEVVRLLFAKAEVCKETFTPNFSDYFLLSIWFNPCHMGQFVQFVIWVIWVDPYVIWFMIFQVIFYWIIGRVVPWQTGRPICHMGRNHIWVITYIYIISVAVKFSLKYEHKTEKKIININFLYEVNLNFFCWVISN